jgi:hypothetical protein
MSRKLCVRACVRCVRDACDHRHCAHSRAWTYETSVAAGVDLPEGVCECVSVNSVRVCAYALCACASELPHNDYVEYFGPDYKLHVRSSNMANNNTREYLKMQTYACGCARMC